MLAALHFLSCKKHENIPSSPPAVTDTAKLRLAGYSYTPGNLNAGQLDTFTLRFNKPIHLNSLQYLSSYCLPDLQHTLTDGDSVILFYNFRCGGLGGDYPFKYSVTDSSGSTLSDSIVFHCYYHRAITAGTIQNYFLSKDGKYCWVVTNSPDQIVCLGLADTGYQKTYALNFTPFNAGYNYYNNLIYIPAADLQHRDTVYVMDPSTGEIIKPIPIPKDTIDHTDNYAYDVLFGSNGYGILRIENDDGVGAWLVLDSRLNDTLYLHPFFTPGLISGMRDLASAAVKFDGSEIIGLESNGSCRLVRLDCNTHNLTEVSFPFSPTAISWYIVANKFADEVFVVNLQPPGMNQFLVQNYVMVGAFTGFDAYSASSADFSYRAGENFYVYYFDDNTAGVVDYNSGNILKNTDVNPSLSRISSTTDGGYIVFMGNNNITMIESKDLYP
jgi:hypothetical protein